MSLSDTTYAEGFGEVSRTAGTIFKYVLLAATLVGIVALGILLVYVVNDAVQPFTADAGWHLTFLGTLVLPTVLAGWYLRGATEYGVQLGFYVVGVFLVSFLFAGGVSMVFVDIVAPTDWFAYFVAVAVSLGAIVFIERYTHRIPFSIRFSAAIVSVAVVVYGVPWVFDQIGIAPVDWMIMIITLGGPAAILAGLYFRNTQDAQFGRNAGLVAFGAVVLSAFVGPAIGIGSIPAIVITSVALIPTGAYAANIGVTRPTDRLGLVLPAVILAGGVVGTVIVDLAGFAGPQSWVTWEFLTSPHSSNAEAAGLYPAIGGSILLMVTVAVLSFPLGVGAAVYLEEYASDNRITRIIDINISNLAGVPSVVYGLLGLGVFVTYLGQPTGTVLIGGATLALLILPIVIISAREAIRSVPDELRQASFGVGATRYQTIKNIVLPRAFPGVLTGTILALGRAIGETAPLIMIGAPNVVFNLPSSLSSKVSAMPLQVYAWASLYAGPDFYQKAVPAGVVVLLVVLLSMNSIAIVLRNKYQRESA